MIRADLSIKKGQIRGRREIDDRRSEIGAWKHEGIKGAMDDR